MHDPLGAALQGLNDPRGDAHRLSHWFVQVLPVTGAAVSTLGGVLGTETISASEPRAARLDELQFDLGEGPCWDALRSARPVAEPALMSTGRWPAFVSAVRDYDVCSIFAFPLHVGTLHFGAVDLYSLTPLSLSALQTNQATEMAEAVSRRLLKDALSGIDEEGREFNPHSRRAIHQATGMVLAQLEISPEDAELVIQGHAFGTGRSMMEVAAEITGGKLTFVRRADRIEAVT
jgi:hypothetical protein